MGAVHESVRIAATPQKVWAILEDFGGIAKWNTILASSRLLDTENGGVGAARHCVIKVGGFTKERVTAWETGKGYTWEIFETDVPIARATNRFTLRPEGTASLVDMDLDFTLKGGPLGKLMEILFVERKMRQSVRETLGALKVRAEAGETIRVEGADAPRRAA